MQTGHLVLSAGTMIGDKVRNPQGEDLGKLEDIMISTEEGCIEYAVLSFGGVMGMGDKLFAIPWEALQIDTEAKEFVLDVPRDRLEKAPGFDKEHWPDMADPQWGSEIRSYYGYERSLR